ncbi:hypothetical protein DL96DRAFT_1597363 [Flagelloscypha sp. PMI_526]|nr:hypothetical protein DL96DRAFT_1597363 [Flagelloscypha sp. PMI_526]
MSGAVEKMPPLDPGPRARRSKPFSCYGCLLRCFAILGILVIAAILFFLGMAGYDLAKNKTKSPHFALYQNETWAQVLNHSAVVRPLVSHEDTFDILATVWLRGDEIEQTVHRESLLADRRKDESVSSDEEVRPMMWTLASNMYGDNVWTRIGKRPTKEEDDLVEHILFSEIILKDVRLRDKNLHAQIPISLPLSVFLEKKLASDYLRASFVLLPSTKDLAAVRNFSTWRPEYVQQTNWRARPSRNSNTRRLIDEAIDSFAITTPLLEFHPFPNPCEDALKTAGVENLVQKQKKNHPFVLTRTHLRILDETHLFNLDAYNQFHDNLRNTSCGLGYIGEDGQRGPPHRSICELERSYTSVGTMETRLELEIPNENDEIEIQWAYAPYLNVAPHASGILDIKPLPINRINCSEHDSYTSALLPTLEPSLQNDTMEFIWHVSLTGRTPGKMRFSDTFSFPPVVNVSMSEAEKWDNHVSFERSNAIRGHHLNPDSHIRRRMVASFFEGLFITIYVFALPVYLWRLPSTVGLSIRSLYIQAMVGILTIVVPVVKTTWEMKKVETWFSLLWGFSLSLMLGFDGLVALKTSTRMEFGPNPRVKGFIKLPIRFAEATHLERASARVDGRSSWTFIVALIASCFALFFFVDLGSYSLFPSLRPPSDDIPPLIERIMKSLNDSVTINSLILQIIMNFRSHTFAGMYKFTTWLYLAANLLAFLANFKALFGNISDPGFNAEDIWQTIVAAVLVWQASSLPSPKFDQEDEHEN